MITRNLCVLIGATLLASTAPGWSQYARTPGGSTVDVKVLARTPASLINKPVIGSDGQTLGTVAGFIHTGQDLSVIIQPAGSTADQRIVLPLEALRIPQGQPTLSLTAAGLAGQRRYRGGAAEVTGNNMTLGDAISAFD
jgi:hypothetical protein